MSVHSSSARIVASPICPSIGIEAERALQPLDRLHRPGIDRAVIDDEIDAGGQIIAAHRVPILVAVDVVALGRLHLVDRAQRQALAPAPAVIDALDHALVGAPAGILRIVDLAALVDEDGALAIGKAFFHGPLTLPR
jgi:hypothetical protein